jgi:phosphoglycerate dehydrogenase-like enzyme
MNCIDKVVVCSKSFSKNITLRSEILKRYKYVKFNDNGILLKGKSLINFMAGHTKAITALEKIDRYVLENLSDLKVIGKYGVGLDMIDMKSMIEFGIELGWKPGINKRAVAELTLGLALSMIRKIPQANKLVIDGVWKQLIGNQLTNKTFGIIGCGNVGKEVVKLLKPFSCKILAYDIAEQDEYYYNNGILAVTLDELLTNTDIISLHLPLNKDTKNILSQDKLELLSKSTILINVARGGLVDESALKSLLKNGKLAAAAFDVFEQEPPIDLELLNLPNFFVTPHIGGSAEESILDMGFAAIDGLDNHELPFKFI